MKKKNPVIQMRESELRKMQDKCRQEGVLSMSIILYSAIRDVTGYGRIRMGRIHKKAERIAESIAAGHVKVADLQNNLKDEVKITIGMKGEEK